MTPDIAAIRERSALWVKNGCPQPEHQYDMAPNDRADLLVLLGEALAALRGMLPAVRCGCSHCARARAVLAKLERKEGGNDGR